ncbi:Chemical-damaging agent resistance protein C [Halomicronema hongdechloris C2206]|uniref:Chemical-damaging agent resistance protein C n=1 Tax=Halomicronema hongdechloris C2206 TaxID=1641165 RepID=A0A1Z3HH38_9CYAN|nr:TerD family protein [Halomicronema hongdechloris]ASC69583.1 Chemical-damaging agent resistance protein C [Halomicronema hongdechloris C2206]
MAIKLTTGQRISLRKEAPGLTTLLLGLSWDLLQEKGIKKLFKSDFDLDAAVLCLDEQGRLRSGNDVVYYGHLNHPSGAITHLGDNTTGEGDEDNEQVLVNLPQVPAHIARIVFVCTIYECFARRQNFGQMGDAYVRLVDMEQEHEIASYSLSHDDYREQTAIVLAEVYRQEGRWQVAVLGKGMRVGSLQALVELYTTP